jgi:hypothetical protein
MHNGHRIRQMALKYQLAVTYTNIVHSKDFTYKAYQNWAFGMYKIGICTNWQSWTEQEFEKSAIPFHQRNHLPMVHMAWTNN